MVEPELLRLLADWNEALLLAVVLLAEKNAEELLPKESPPKDVS